MEIGGPPAAVNIVKGDDDDPANTDENQYYHDLANLPPGFRFHPTDEEIITHYLTQKVIKPASFTASAIGQVDLNKCEPWDLPQKAKMGEKEWFFFCQRDRKYPTGMRTNRATDSGYWKATGKDKEIYKHAGKHLVGMKKTLVFYKGRAPRGEKTNWVMHEFRLEGKFSYYNFPSKEEWVVCKVFHKKSAGIKIRSSVVSADDHLQIMTSFVDSPSPSSCSLPLLVEYAPSRIITNNIGRGDEQQDEMMMSTKTKAWSGSGMLSEDDHADRPYYMHGGLNKMLRPNSTSNCNSHHQAMINYQLPNYNVAYSSQSQSQSQSQPSTSSFDQQGLIVHEHDHDAAANNGRIIQPFKVELYNDHYLLPSSCNLSSMISHSQDTGLSCTAADHQQDITSSTVVGGGGAATTSGISCNNKSNYDDPDDDDIDDAHGDGAPNSLSYLDSFWEY